MYIYFSIIIHSSSVTSILDSVKVDPWKCQSIAGHHVQSFTSRGNLEFPIHLIPRFCRGGTKTRKHRGNPCGHDENMQNSAHIVTQAQDQIRDTTHCFTIPPDFSIRITICNKILLFVSLRRHGAQLQAFTVNKAVNNEFNEWVNIVFFSLNGLPERLQDLPKME